MARAATTEKIEIVRDFAVLKKGEVTFGESCRGTGFAADYNVDLYETSA